MKWNLSVERSRRIVEEERVCKIKVEKEEQKE